MLYEEKALHCVNRYSGGLFSMQLNELLSEYLLDIQIQNYTPKTIKGYKGNCRRFIEFMKVEYNIEKLEDITHLHIKGYIKQLHKKGRSPVYMNTILKNIRSMLAYAVDERYIQQSPMDRVTWLKEEKKVFVVPTDEEIAKMLNVYRGSKLLDIRNATIMAMFVDTGIRCNELIELTPADVIGGAVIINGKGRKQRYVPLSPLMQKQLLKYQRAREIYYKDSLYKVDKLFLSSTGKILTTEAIERVVRHTGLEVGVNPKVRVSPHTLRHYYAIKMLDNGVDVYSVARLMGHNSIKTTQRYLTATTDKQILHRTSNNTPLATLLVR